MKYNNRRDFLKKACIAAGGFSIASTFPSFIFPEEADKKFDFKISLAEWSLHKSLFSNKITNLDFPVVAKKQFGIDAVEYVNQFFMDKAKDTAYLNELKKICSDNGVKSLLIMVDQEGPLADSNKAVREKAVDNHYKWIDAAKHLGCHSIRVNLHSEGSNGVGSKEEWSNASMESLQKLSEYGAKLKINVLAENHGGYSSDAGMLKEVIKEVNNPYCKTLVDVANFCIRREKGDLWESPCVERYDPYKGVQELLPFAKGVSAKTFDFDEKGNEVTTDFRRMLKLVKDSGFEGYIGVEYEGNNIPEHEGIIATKKLLERLRKELA